MLEVVIIIGCLEDHLNHLFENQDGTPRMEVSKVTFLFQRADFELHVSFLGGGRVMYTPRLPLLQKGHVCFADSSYNHLAKKKSWKSWHKLIQLNLPSWMDKTTSRPFNFCIYKSGGFCFLLIYIYISIYLYIYVNIYAYIYVNIFIFLYIHIYIHT